MKMNFQKFGGALRLGVLSALIGGATLAGAGRADAAVVINEVYGGGGNGGATLKNDFIELYNNGTTPVDLTGYTLQYASTGATAVFTVTPPTGNSAPLFTTLSGTIQPGGYFLVQEAAGTGGTQANPTPDQSGGIALSATGGKVALANDGTVVTATAGPNSTFSSNVVDFVGYGVASSYEGSGAAPVTAAASSVSRKTVGVDSNDNKNDFALTNPPTPMNSSAGTTPTPPPDPNATATPVPTATTVPTATPVPSPTATPIPLGPPSTTLVISEVYGGSGGAGAPFNSDFIELYNLGSTTVNLAGYSVQYGSATGTTFAVTPLNGTIAPGAYYLVQERSGGTTATALPTPNATGGIDLSSTNGKVALVSSATAVTGPSSANVIDFVGYGVANQSETAPTAATSNTTSASRTPVTTDTNNNSTDFTVGAPTPQTTTAVTAPSQMAYALAGTSLYSFNTATPGTTTLVGDTTLTLEGIDFNPATGQLFAIDVNGATTQLYTLNLTTGTATAVGAGFPTAGTAGPNSYDLTGQALGFDFNPKTLQNDGSIRIRVTAQNGSDLRLNSATGGIAAVDGTLNGAATSSVGSAYSNNVAQTSGTTVLYDVSDATDSLYTQNPPNNGTLALVGATGIDVKADTGFDIFTDASGTGNTAYLATDANATATGSEFFTVNLATGVATAAGDFGALAVSDIAIRPLAPAVATSGLVISEFRLSGPGGATDEFIELANTTTGPVILTGLTLQAGGTAIPGLDLSGKIIPTGGHFLITNSAGYSLGNYASGDVSYTTDIPVGSTLSLNNGATAVDAVGTFSVVPSASTNQYSYVRRLESGVPLDTGSDTNDFNLVDTSNTQSTVDQTGVGPLNGARLGAPGPQNVQSPIQRNALIGVAPLNIPGSGLASDARMPSSGNGSLDPKGRLSLRRTLTNKSTTITVTRLRFRIVAITAGNNATPADGTGTADVRALSSSTLGVRYRDSAGTIQTAALGLALEAPSSPTAPVAGGGAAAPPVGALGGGLNSSWSVVNFPSGGLAPGQSLSVEFLLGIIKDGNYRLVADIELLP